MRCTTQLFRAFFVFVSCRVGLGKTQHGRSEAYGHFHSQVVTVKKLVRDRGDAMEKALKRFKAECVLLSGLKHRNIIAFEGVTLHPVTCIMQLCSRGNQMEILHDRR